MFLELSENNNEIGLHSLLINLKYVVHDIRPYTMFQMTEENIIERSFETFRNWSIAEQTSYIESIFLRCSLQPIVRFVGDGHTTIVDGYHRYLAISNFCGNKLVLSDKGLRQLKFLAGKRFEDLSDEEIIYFKKCEPINFIDYSYNNSNKKLSMDEECEIERYLHILYNTGLKLEKEEFQKAQFSDDLITNKIREKIISDEEFLKMLESLKQFNGRTIKNKIDNILLNCRLLIASTYSNMCNFSCTSSVQIRIDENYYPNINNLDKNKIFQDFDLNIFLIYKRLIDTQKWEKFSILHTKPFLDATYWLISIIRKDNLGDPEKFDFMAYLEYFADNEETEKTFESFQSHYQKNIYKRYYAVAKYYELISGYKMDGYFSKNVSKKTFGLINNLDDLYSNHFSYNSYKLKISTLFEELENNNYNIRPYYQRKECMNVALSSRVIESILMNIVIPKILVYNNKSVTEVVDGQQRLLSLIGYFDRYFYNENGEKEYSNKRGYTLKDLRVLNNLNDCKIKTKNSDNKKELPIEYRNKILNSELCIVSIDSNSGNFSAVDHFIRLNKNVSNIMENSYRMWSLIGDIKVLNYEKNITIKYINSLLPPKNRKRSANMVTFKLAALFYSKNVKEVRPNDYTNMRVTKILKDFNITKNTYLFKEPEKIELFRKELLKCLDQVAYFYEKIERFLDIKQKSLKDMMEIRKHANIPLINYYYLFVLIGDLTKEDMLYNFEKIYVFLNEFFIKYNSRTKNDDINLLINYYCQKISVYNSTLKD